MAGNARTGGGRVDDFSCVGPLVAVDCVDIMAQAIAHRQFIRFWFARLSGVMANQMLMVAVAVAWHMYDITSSAWDLGLVGLFQFIPALLMTLPAGHVADRFHRGRIFAVCMLAQAVVAAWLVGATQWGHVTRELIFGLSVLLGMARAFQMPVQQSLTPMLVPPEFLQRAIAMSSSGQQVAVISGPALGGLLYLAGASVVYATCAVLLLLACALVLTVRYTHRPSHLAATWGTVMAGVAFVWQRKVLLGGATSLDLFAVLLGGATALLPIYARLACHGSAAHVVGAHALADPALGGAACVDGGGCVWPVDAGAGRDRRGR